MYIQTLYFTCVFSLHTLILMHFITSITEMDMTNGEDYDSERSEGDKEDDIEDVKDKKRRLFNIMSVNASGNLDVDQIKDDGRPLKLERKANSNIGTCVYIYYVYINKIMSY